MGDGKEYHLTPANDLREHIAETHCWCKPTESDEESGLWLHNSMDRREEYEDGVRKPG